MKRTLLTALMLFSTFSFGSAVDDRFIQLRNNTAIRAANAANTGVVNLVQSSATDAVVLANALSVASTGGVSLSSSALTLANLASDPGSPAAGDVYFNSVSNKIKFYDGSAWITIQDTDTGMTALTGDVTASGSGSQAASVIRIQAIPVSASTPTSGQIFKYNGSQWAPGTDLGITALTSDVTASGVGSQAATVVKIQGRTVASTAPSNLQVLKWNAGSSQWEPGLAATNTWQSTIAYSTNSYSSDGVNAPADAISFISGMVGQSHYLASDDNDGSVGDGTPSPLGVIAGSYTGTDAGGDKPGADLNLLAGNGHQLGWSLGAVSAGNLNLYAGVAVGSGDGGGITINGGTASHGGNGNGGNVELNGGSPSGTGLMGHITLTGSLTQMNSPVMILPTAASDASGASQGWLYYNTATNRVRLHDNVAWADFGGANTALSNLASTAVNAVLNDSGGIASLDLTNRAMYDTSALLSLGYDARSLFDPAGNESADWANRILTYSSAQPSIDWANSSLFDTSNFQALNYQNRILGASDGSTNLDWSSPSLVLIPADIDPSVSDTWNVGNATNEYASMWANTFAGIGDINLVAGAGTVNASGDAVSVLANTGNIDLTSTSGLINLTATSGTGGITINATTEPVFVQSDAFNIQNSAGSSTMTIAGSVITPTTGSDLTVGGNIISNATGTRNIGSSSNEYLAAWSRAFKGITNVIVQAVSGNATVQGTNVVLSNGTNTMTFTGTSLNPSVNNAISLGSAANNIFSLGRFRSVSAGDGTSTLLQMDGTAGQTFPGGQAISASLRNTSNTGTHIGIYSTNNTTANTVASGNLYIGTGNKTAGNANSGDMILRTGTPFGTGVRGTMAFQDGSEGTAHYLWSSTDTTGKGKWVGSLNDASNLTAVDYLNRALLDTSGNQTVDWQNTILNDSSAALSENWNGRLLYDAGATASIDWGNRFLQDNGVLNAFDWQNRQFIANDGSTVVIDTSNAAGPNFNSTVITNPAGGTFTIAPATGSTNVTDARVTTSSLVIVVLIQNDLTAKIANVVPNSGSFDVNLSAVATANTDARYVIIENPN